MTRLTVVLLLLLLAACGGASPDAAPPADPDGRPGQRVRVLDGDSLEAEVDGRRLEIRLVGINAPERGECWADEARAALAAAVAPGPVQIEDVGGEDRYGRILAYLWDDGGRLVNLVLVEGGAAMAVSGSHREVGAFLAAEEEAFAAGTGLWAPDACGASHGSRVSIDEIVYDPAGEDEGNEYVRLRNEGPLTVDIGGWTIRDESSVHRFRFPRGTLVGPGESVTLRSGCAETEPGTFWWGCGYDPVWSNSGDTALLLDEHGNVAARRRY